MERNTLDIIGLIFSHAFHIETLSIFGAILSFSFIISAVIVLILLVTRSTPKKMWQRWFILFLALTLFGAFAGYAGGISREAAVGAIIPAVLALAGGLAAYLFGIDTSRGAVASIALIAFTFGIFFGYSFAAMVRVDHDRNREHREACFNLFYDPNTYRDEPTMNLAMGTQSHPRYARCLEVWNQ